MAVVGFWKVVRPLNAVDVHRVPKARVGESARGGTSPSRYEGFGDLPGDLPHENL